MGDWILDSAREGLDHWIAIFAFPAQGPCIYLPSKSSADLTDGKSSRMTVITGT